MYRLYFDPRPRDEYGRKLDEVEAKVLEEERRYESDLDDGADDIYFGEDPAVMFECIKKKHPEITEDQFILEMQYRDVTVTREQLWRS